MVWYGMVWYGGAEQFFYLLIFYIGVREIDFELQVQGKERNLVMLSFSTGKAVVRAGESLIGKLAKGKGPIYAKDLVGATFGSVSQGLRATGLDTSIKHLKTGNKIVTVTDLNRSGLAGLFPGGVIAPNAGKLDKVVMKFNKNGDILQMSAIQNFQNGAITSSTIRTADGVEALKAAGVKSPTNYVQAFVDKINNYRYFNKTSGMYGTTVPEAQEGINVLAQKASAAKAQKLHKAENFTTRSAAPKEKASKNGFDSDKYLAKQQKRADEDYYRRQSEMIDDFSKPQNDPLVYDPFKRDPLDPLSSDPFGNPYDIDPFGGMGF